MKRMIFLSVLVVCSLAFGGEYWPITNSIVTATLDTNRVSGAITIKAGMISANRNRYGGVSGYITVSDISNPGDAAFGNVDTCILTLRTSFGLRSIPFLVDTLTTLPGTTYYYNDLDSLWRVMDSFVVDYYLADSTEDYAGGDDTLVCTLTNVSRLFEDKYLK